MPELTRKSRHEHSVARAPMKPQGLNRLAPDQLDILRLLAQGLTIEAIARRAQCVRTHRAAQGACVQWPLSSGDSTIEAVVWAVRQQLI